MLRPPLAALVTASISSVDTDESIIPAPYWSAALATVAPAPGSKLSSDPTGASTTGMRSVLPSSVRAGSSLATSTSTRGLRAMRSRASRLRFTVVSVSVPPTR